MSEKAQGFEEYTPSRLEWLVVMLNSYVSYINIIPGELIHYVYILGSDENTIVMRMRHYADISLKERTEWEDIGKSFAQSVVETYKWDSWINIKTEFDPIDRPPKE